MSAQTGAGPRRPGPRPGRSDPHPTVRLRPVDLGDLDRVGELEVELFGSGAWSRAAYEDELVAPGRRYLAAVDESGTIVGYAGIALAPDSEVMTVGVGGAWRRRGIGTRLLDALLAAAREVRARRVFLEVRTTDVGARRMYERAGFRAVGLRRGYYQPDGGDALVMCLELRGAPPAGTAVLPPAGAAVLPPAAGAAAHREVRR